MIAAAFDARGAGRSPNVLGVLAAEIRPQFQGRGLANRVLDAMADLARAGLTHLIAPVRPSFKDRYPITPIERYVTWTRENGEPFDPLDPRPHPPRRHDRHTHPPLDADHRDGRRVGRVDRHALPR
jgi:hypothetical protein